MSCAVGLTGYGPLKAGCSNLLGGASEGQRTLHKRVFLRWRGMF